jgi:hypothetical protein
MSLNPTTSAVAVEDEAILVIDDATAPTGRGEDGRISYEIYNNGPNTCYLGASDVTTSTGIPLPAGSSRSISIRHYGKVYAICATSNTADVRVLMVP